MAQLAYSVRDGRQMIVGLDASTGAFTHIIPKATVVPPFCSFEYRKTDPTHYAVSLSDGASFSHSLYQKGDSIEIFSDGSKYHRTVQAGAPIVYMDEPDRPTRTFIRDSRISGGSCVVGVGNDPPEWAQGSGVTAEAILPRGLILAHELTGSGRMQIDVQGQMLATNGMSGNIALRIYTSASTDPAVAIGSATLRATHTVTVADPAGGSTLGDFHWRFTLLPLGADDLSNIQIWRSDFSYRRHGTDTLTVDRAGGQLTSTTSPTAPDFHADTIIIPTTQKTTITSTSRLLPYSIDGIVTNGEDGAV